MLLFQLHHYLFLLNHFYFYFLKKTKNYLNKKYNQNILGFLFDILLILINTYNLN